MTGRQTIARMRLAAAAAATALALAAALAGHAVAQGGGGSFPSVVATPLGNFNTPVYVASPPGKPNLLFVVEKRGVVRVMRNNAKLERSFLDITHRVSTQGEQGLLSIAFAPDYAKSRRFYAYYTNRSCKKGGCAIEVAEFRRSKGSQVRARAKSHRRVIAIPHPNAANHNGGTVMFGPDRKLWLATGDGGGGNDQYDNARKKSSLLGKLLRIIPTRKRPNRPGYRVPKDNPFVGKRGREEIWALGLRNPFRFSFDAERNAIAIGDVGQQAQEEVNFLTIGKARRANFGWPRWEGTIERSNQPQGPSGLPLWMPLHTYANPAEGRAVAGGVVLRDRRFEGFGGVPDPDDGYYLYADTFSHAFTAILPNLSANAPSAAGALPGIDVSTPVGFGTDSRDRVYVASLDGGIYRLDPAGPP